MSSQAVLPRRSRRLATIIPASHWISIGYSQVDAQLMENLQLEIKKYCDGEFGSDVRDIELRGRRNDNTLPYHDMLLPHWKKFAKAIHGRASVENIEFYNLCLPPPVLDIMFPTFQSINLISLSLGNIAWGSDGYQRLLSFLNDNRSLKKLIMGEERINDLSTASSLSDAVRDHPTLETLGLIHCGLNNTAILKKILEGCTRLKGMRKLGIGMNNIGSDSVTVLADFIRSNNMSDDDALVLASALTQNTNLEDLDLSKNDITEAGEKTLLKAVYDPTSMDSIIESNHTCKIYTYDSRIPSIKAQRPPLEQEVLRINNNDDRDISIRRKIRHKVVLALCGYGSNVELFDLSYLNDLPLQLMPRVLELIQEHSQSRSRAVITMPNQLEKDALSRLFHTLRGWELPLIFENLRGPSPEGGGKKRKRRKTRR